MVANIFKIPEFIEDNEILVRFIFTSDFKNKKIEVAKINSGDIFLDTRNLGVSLQRHFYCDENLCKKLANGIPTKEYVGFLIFEKKSFLEVMDQHLEERKEFDAEIVFTPLDENNEVIEDKSNIFSNTPKNPSHSDLFYLNPAVINDESPNIAIRLFSRKLYKASKLVIDHPSQDEHCPYIFSDL